MNIILKGPVICKLPAPARSYRAGLNWAWVIQTPSVAGFIFPPYAAAFHLWGNASCCRAGFISHSLFSAIKIWSNLMHPSFKTAADHHWHGSKYNWCCERISIMFSGPKNTIWQSYFIAVSCKIDTRSLKISYYKKIIQFKQLDPNY